eukprot:1159145-Pelagomonas_calceolata.AAC.3
MVRAHAYLVPGLSLFCLPLLSSSHSADLDLVQLGRELVVEHKLVSLSHVLRSTSVQSAHAPATVACCPAAWPFCQAPPSIPDGMLAISVSLTVHKHFTEAPATVVCCSAAQRACQALPPMAGGMLAEDITSCKPWSTTKACQALPPMAGGMLAGDVTSCKPWSMTKVCQALPPMAGGMLTKI